MEIQKGSMGLFYENKIEKGWTVLFNGNKFVVASGGSKKIKLIPIGQSIIMKEDIIDTYACNVEVISRNKVGILGKY
jgi:hypothetical protein